MKSFTFPGNIEPDILAIGSQQIPYMRTQWFSELVLESEAMLLAITDCPDGKIISYTATGTAAMDSCVTSFVSSRQRALVLNGGTFGARWGDLCRYYDIPHDEFSIEFGREPDWDVLENITGSGKYDVLLMQHHETSSGYLYDIERVSKLCLANDLYFVVDAISSFLADPLSIKKYGIDITVLSSHKGLNLPPGLSFLVLSERVLEEKRYLSKQFYFDWADNLSNLQRGQTPYSPATHLFMQLHARLLKVQELGVASLINDVREKALAFRVACHENGWSFTADRKSNCLTGVYLPFPVLSLVNDLVKKKTFIMPSERENMIRVAHLGTLNTSDHLELIGEIVRWADMEHA